MPSSFFFLFPSFAFLPFLSILTKVFDLKKHLPLPLFILRRHCPFFSPSFFLYMTRKSHDYDYLGAIFFFFYSASYFASKEAFHRKTRRDSIFLLIHFIFGLQKNTEGQHMHMV